MPPWLMAWGIRIGVGLLMSAVLGLGGFAWITKHDSKIYKKAVDSCPPQNVYNAPSVIDQRKNMRCFPFPLGHWGVGICHD